MVIWWKAGYWHGRVLKEKAGYWHRGVFLKDAYFPCQLRIFVMTIYYKASRTNNDFNLRIALLTLSVLIVESSK